MLEATIHLCDVLNPGFGYQVRVYRDGLSVLFTSRDPATGRDILTFGQALAVLDNYKEDK